MKIAIIGAGWSGLAAAVRATRSGHEVAVFEASKTPGGRARSFNAMLPDGRAMQLDNGQHILIGAYHQTLQLMREVGVDPESALLRLPLTMQFPDGCGLKLPVLRAPWDALIGISTARGWSWTDRLSLLRAAARWQWSRFACSDDQTVAQLCQSLSAKVIQELIEPLCVSALNTPADRASAKVFLRVLQDSLFSTPGGSNLLLPRIDLSACFPDAAARWLAARGGRVALGQRVQALTPQSSSWRVQDEAFDQVVLAVSATDAVRLLEQTEPGLSASAARRLQSWRATAQVLQFEAITTVYAYGPGARLRQPMLALRSDPANPAQFAFDRGQLNGPAGLIALVVSASSGELAATEQRVLAQAHRQLGLDLKKLRSVTEKRATFACTAGLQRPGMDIAPGLRACGDYVDGPYPATLEGAVRSGLSAIT